MNNQKITISLPHHIYEQLVSRTRKRHVSKYVATAIERQILEEKDIDPINEFIAMREKLPKVTRIRILQAINKGRR